MESQTPAPDDLRTVEPSPFRDTPESTPRKEVKAANLAKPRYMDAALHGKVQKMHNRGIYTDLGPKWGNFEVRLRPTHSHHVVVKRENAETAIRIQLGLQDDDPIPADKNIEINRQAVTMAITGAHGLMNISTADLDPEDPDTPELVKAFEAMRRSATERGAKAGVTVIEEDDLVLLQFTSRDRLDKDRAKTDPDGDEARIIREILSPYLEVSFPFLTTLVRMCRGLQKVRDEELGPLGERFTYGRHVKDGWAD